MWYLILLLQVTDGSLGEGSAITDVPDGLVSYYVDSPGFGDFINGKSIIIAVVIIILLLCIISCLVTLVYASMCLHYVACPHMWEGGTW